MAVTITKAPAGSKAPASDTSKYAKHLTGTPALAEVTVQKKNKHGWEKEATSEEVVHPNVTTHGTPAMVTIGGSRTVNLGDFNSVKLSVELSMPSDPASIDETFEFASNWVSERIGKALEDAGVKT